MASVDRKEQLGFWEKEQPKRRAPEHPVICAIVKPELDLISKYITFKDKSILDVGSGDGYFAYHLSKYTSVVASDISDAMLKENLVSRKVKCDARYLPFKGGSFDIVIASNLLHHVENPKEVISEMHRVSRKYIVLSDTNRNNLFVFIYSLIKKIDRGVLNISKEYLTKVLLGLDARIIFSTNTGFISRHLTPMLILPILKKIEPFLVSIFGGIYCIIVSEKNTLKETKGKAKGCGPCTACKDFVIPKTKELIFWPRMYKNGDRTRINAAKL